MCTELSDASELVLGRGPAGGGTDADMSDSDVPKISRQYNGEGVNPRVAEPDAAVRFDNLLRMERRIASLEKKTSKTM